MDLQEKIGSRTSISRGLFVINFAVSLGFGMVDPFFSLYVHDMGATGLYLAAVFSVYTVSKMLFAPLVGYWSDRLGRRTFIILGLSGYVVIALLYLQASSVHVVILLRFLQGVAAALFRPVAAACVGDHTPREREGTAMATFDISFYGAVALGPLLGGVVKDLCGMHALFLLLFLLCFGSLLWGILLIPEEKGHRAPHVRTDYQLLAKNRLLLGLLGFIFTKAAGITLFIIFMPLLMRDLHFNAIQTGIVMASGTVVTALLLRPLGVLSDRLARRVLVITGGVTAPVITFCLPLVSDFGWLVALSTVLGFASVVSLPASAALLVKEGQRCGMGLAFGCFNASMNLGFLVAPLLGSFVCEKIGIHAVFYLAGSIGLVGVCCFQSCSTSDVRAGVQPAE
jgi:MFS family permease